MFNKILGDRQKLSIKSDDFTPLARGTLRNSAHKGFNYFYNLKHIQYMITNPHFLYFC
jgi:hypothetical protein